MTSLDVTNNTQLSILQCQSNDSLSTLNLGSIDSLTELYCSDNSLVSLDVSNNTQLQKLSCYDNQLTSMDVSNNTVLSWLDCADNNISSLNVGNNPMLTYLRCAQNQISSLDVTDNELLTDLKCGNNPINNLDVTMLASLRQLFCHNNQLSVLDLTNNGTLHTLHCNNNNLVVLDLSECDSLAYLDCDSNSLTSLNVQNSNNTNFTHFHILGNPGLNCILVDDPVWSAVNWPNKPPSADFRVQCNLPGYLPTDSLVAWYPFNGDAIDESGNGNNGTVNYGGVSGTDRFSNPNSSLVSIANDMDVGCGSDQSLHIAGDLTISLWVNPSSFAAWETLISFGGNGEQDYNNYLYYLSWWGSSNIGVLTFFHEGAGGVQ